MYNMFMLNTAQKAAKSKRRWLIPVIIIALIVLFCVVTYVVTPLVIVRPSHNKEAEEELTLIELEEMFAEKQPLNIPLVEDIKIETDSGNLYGWWLHHANNTYTGPSNLLLYFGGYDEDSATSALRFLDQMSETETFAAYDIAVVDFPGFGTSEGRPTDDAIRDASAAIFQYFNTGKNIRNIYVMGYSFGCGPAAYVASLYDVSGLILLAPYESIYDLYNSVTPVFYGPMRLLISFQMDAGEYAESADCDSLVIASRSDSRIPYHCSLEFVEHLPENHEVVTLENVPHGELPVAPETLSAIQRFLSD